MTDDRHLVVGLGNPGPRYAGNRHNAGFFVLDLLAERMGARFKAHKGVADVASGQLAGVAAALVKPRSFMNESGRPVASVARFYKVPLERLTVVHDELDLPYGALRLKRGGGDGGHNGLRSISAALGKDYCPGPVRHRPPAGPAGSRRLRAAGFQRRGAQGAGLPRRPLRDAVEVLLRDGLEAAQNAYND